MLLPLLLTLSLIAPVCFAQTANTSKAGVVTPALGGTSAPPPKPLPATPSAATPVAPVIVAEPQRVLVVPSRETSLVAQMVGRIDKMPSQLGASFKQGQILVQFDCSEQDARLKMSQAEYVGAKETYDSKVRLKALDAAGDIEVQQAAAQAERTRAQIELVRSQLKLCRVEAPFAGRIVKLHVKEFQSTSVGQPLMDIVSLGSLKVRLNVPSKWLSWLRIGSGFKVTIDENGKSYPVKVTALNGRIDAVSQSIEIEGLITKGDASLLVGMSGSAFFSQAQ